MLVLYGQILGQKIVCTADDELGRVTEELLDLLVVSLLGRVCSVRIAPAVDGVFVVLPEVVLGAEEVGIGEVEK